MAKKTKESNVNDNIDISKNTTSTKKSVSTKRNVVAKKATTSKKATVQEKKANGTKTKTKKRTSTSSKATTQKKTSTSSSTAKKVKASAIKKSSTRKTASTNKKTTVQKSSLVEFRSEYYDLPYMYNKTVVTVLAQTPKTLFVYWEISDDDRSKFKKIYGEDFFEKTRPVLIVFNDTMRYSFEVDINDFANSWYLHVNDADCNYHIELGRRPYNFNSYYTSFKDSQNIDNINSTDNEISQQYIPYYIYITSSNKMTAPNNRILFDTGLKSVKYRNVKTGHTFEKDVKDFVFITNLGIFRIQDLYKEIYPNESFEARNVCIGNPSSSLTSSGIFSLQL